MKTKFIEIYPMPNYLDDDSFGWAQIFKDERILIKTSDVLKAWIHMQGNYSFVAIDYFDRSRNSKNRAMYGHRNFDNSRANWSYATAAKDFETLSMELCK